MHEWFTVVQRVGSPDLEKAHLFWFLEPRLTPRLSKESDVLRSLQDAHFF